jgi:hypothetical protein
MKTKPKTFGAVAASRQWREDAGRMLDAMPMTERLAFLEGLRVRGAGSNPAAAREDATPNAASEMEAMR